MQCKSSDDARKIIDMTRSEGWHVLADAIREDIATATKRIVGSDLSEREYIACQNKIRALESVLSFVQARHERLEKGGQ